MRARLILDGQHRSAEPKGFKSRKGRSESFKDHAELCAQSTSRSGEIAVSRVGSNMDHKPSDISFDANAVLDAFRSPGRPLDASRHHRLTSRGPLPVLVHALSCKLFTFRLPFPHPHRHPFLLSPDIVVNTTSLYRATTYAATASNY